MMHHGRGMGFLDRFLRYSLIGVLSLCTLAFLFVFLLNWEDWFFGTKLDGPAAGLYLLAKWCIAGALAIALVKYPRYSRTLAGIAAVFFGWLLMDSSVTIQRNGAGSFSPVLAVCLAVAVGFLIVHAISTWDGGKEKKG